MEGFREVLGLLGGNGADDDYFGCFVVLLAEESSVEAVPGSGGCVFERVGSYGECVERCRYCCIGLRYKLINVTMYLRAPQPVP